MSPPASPRRALGILTRPHWLAIANSQCDPAAAQAWRISAVFWQVARAPWAAVCGASRKLIATGMLIRSLQGFNLN
jgi:hypothetical protein